MRYDGWMADEPRTPDQAEGFVQGQVRVTRQMVVQAKLLFLAQSETRTAALLDRLREAVETKKPPTVVINQQVEFLPTLRQLAAWISWTLAGCEAIWELIHANLRLPRGTQDTGDLGGVNWTTVVPGSGGQNSGWNFSNLSLLVPVEIHKPPSARNAPDEPLADADLFLTEIAVPGLHAEVEEALREAVRCFRHELYTASLAMLGKAAEGAWIELGLSLLRRPEAQATLDADKLRANLESPKLGIAKKIGEVVKLYERHDICGALWARAGVRPQDLRNAVIWADTVRDSRNTVHYGVQPAMRNSYDKVAVLLVAAVAHLRVLYLIINAAGSAP
jgi:hypothetical protein